MPRVVSFIVLLAILLVTGAVFFRVMQSFVVPLFLAGVLVVIFEPSYDWLRRKMPGRRKLAALLMTASVLLVVLLPTCWLFLHAYAECSGLIETLRDDSKRAELIEVFQTRAKRGLELYEERFGARPDLSSLAEHTLQQVGGILLGGAQVLLSLTIGMVIMVLALYFFLVDGPTMVSTVMKLSPLDDEYERELLQKFAEVSRAVVLASLLSAITQGLLAGIGYYFALPADAPVVLLTAATMVLAIVPFVGAAAVWVPVCLYLFLYGPVETDGELRHGDTITAAVLAVYGAAVVSSVDNLIKPLVLHGQSNLHPLLALLSVLGGVQVLGPIGILVGPMLVAFLQALLNMLNKELHLMGNSSEADSKTEPDSEAAKTADENPSPAKETGEQAAPAKGDEKSERPPGKSKKGRRRRR